MSKKKKTKVENTEVLDTEELNAEVSKKTKKSKKAKKDKTPMDLETKKTLCKSITAVACVVALCVSIATNTSKISDAVVNAAKTNGGAASVDASDDGMNMGSSADVDASVDMGEVPTDASGEELPTDADVAGDASGDQTATDAGTSSSGNATSGGASSSTPSKTNASSSVPTGVSQIVSYYNTATAKVANKKAPFSKTRSTTEKSYDAGIALKTFKGLVYKFMGVGSDNKFTKSVTSADADSYQKYFQASKLTANDVSSATCTKNGSNYTITLKLKNGTSTVTGGKVVSSNNTALDRCGLACGEKDKDYWDHKTAENVNSAIQDIATSANINESYSNAVITAVVNASTGNLVSLKVSFDFKFELSKVMGASANAQASTVVNMTGFKF